MKYDDASWHSGGDYPKDLPAEAAATHIGMFLTWALLNGLGGEIHTVDSVDALAQLQERRITPGRYFLDQCDGKLTNEDFDEIGNSFAQEYFDLERGGYLADYEALFGQGLPSLYYVQDCWANYDILCPRLKQRFAEWQSPPPIPSRVFRTFTGSLSGLFKK